MNDRKKLTDKEISEKYISAHSPDGLKAVLREIWRESQHSASAVPQEHFVMYLHGDQKSFLRIRSEGKGSDPFVLYVDKFAKPMGKGVKEVLAEFLWEEAGAKERNSSRSFDQWRDNPALWMQDLGRQEIQILIDGGVPPMFPPDLEASRDAMLTEAKFPSQEAGLSHAAIAPMPLLSDNMFSEKEQPLPQPGLIAKIGLFAPKPSADPAARPEPGPKALSDSGMKKR
jgi:hypothetical protein